MFVNHEETKNYFSKDFLFKPQPDKHSWKLKNESITFIFHIFTCNFMAFPKTIEQEEYSF